MQIALEQISTIVFLARVLERFLGLICALGYQWIVILRIWTVNNLLLRIDMTLLLILNGLRIIFKLSGAALLLVLDILVCRRRIGLQLILHHEFIVTVFRVAGNPVRIVELKLTNKRSEFFQSLLFWVNWHLVCVWCTLVRFGARLPAAFNS